MPDEPDEIAAAGHTVVELLGACSAAPDDADVGRAAEHALRNLERLLTAGPASCPPAHD